MNMASEMYGKSTETLRKSDKSHIDFDFEAYDKEVNTLQREVRKKIFTHLSVSGTENLESGLILSHVADFTEQIGDHAKGIHELAKLHERKLECGGLEDLTLEVESAVTSIFKDVVVAFAESDENKASLLITRYRGGIAEKCNELIRRIIQANVSELDGPTAATLALYVRHLKRIAATSKDIATCMVNPFHRIGYKERLEV